MKHQPKRTLIPSTENKTFAEVNPRKIEVVPTVEALLQDAYAIMGVELQYMKSQIERGRHLDTKESRMLVNYVDSLVKASREQREISKQGEESSMTDAELLENAKAAVKALEAKMEDK